MSDNQVIRRDNLRLLDIGPAELATKLGSRYSYWRDMLKDDAKPFGEKVARRIEDGLHLPRGWLDEPQDSPPKKREQKRAVVTAATRAGVVGFGAAEAGLISVTMMAADASPGGSAATTAGEVVTRMDISEPWLLRHATFSSPDNLALVTGCGDSMLPTYSDGDVLLVDRGVTDIRLDAVYVLSFHDEFYIKRIQRRPDGSVIMLSDNTAYQPYQIPASERSRLRVLGRVVMAWNAVRL